MHSCEAEVQLDTRCKSAVSFTPRLSYSQGKIIWYQVYGKMGGPQSRARDFAERSNYLTFPGNEPWFLRRPASRPVTILTELSWLRSTVNNTITKFVPLSVGGGGGGTTHFGRRLVCPWTTKVSKLYLQLGSRCCPPLQKRPDMIWGPTSYLFNR